MIKCVIFDVGGVLVGGNIEDVWNSVNKKLRKKVFCWNRDFIEFHKGNPGESAFYNKLGKRFGLSPILLHNVYVAEYRKLIPVNKDVLRMAVRLKKKGYKVGIISNITPEIKRLNIRRGVFFGFSPVVFSCDVGCKKPHRMIYDILIKKTRMKAEECLLIDDWPSAIDGARKAGMKAILFKNAGQLKKELREMGAKA